MYAIVSTSGELEKVVEKLSTKEEAYREMLEWIRYADDNEGAGAAQALSGSLRVEVLH